ncbi:MAG: aminopeptidase P N-terminal domain-containing protein, partial [bacterium]|nr:aminopeptidase P N-terminal domain-containing protein [bacterium]
MFDANIYIERRKLLKQQIKSAVILFPGNEEAPMNYPANPYNFRQDSSFLYYWGLDFPGLAAIIDVENDEEIIYGEDFSVDDIVWMGPQETMAEKAKRVGVSATSKVSALDEKIKHALRTGRRIHYLPQYRSDCLLKISQLTGVRTALVNEFASRDLIKAVVNQRSIKSAEEVE